MAGAAALPVIVPEQPSQAREAVIVHGTAAEHSGANGDEPAPSPPAPEFAVYDEENQRAGAEVQEDWVDFNAGEGRKES